MILPLTWLLAATTVSVGKTTVQTHIETSVNQNRVEVNVQEQGDLKVKVKDGQVSIEKSPGMRPTIKVKDNISFNERKSVRAVFIYNFLRGFISRFFEFFH